MKIFEKEFPDLPGLNPNIDPEKGSEHQVTVTMTHKQINELKEKWNLDVMPMINNAICGEAYLTISKQISKLIFKSNAKKINEKYEVVPTQVKPFKVDWKDVDGKIANLLPIHYHLPSRTDLSPSWDDDIKKRKAFIVTNEKIGCILKQQKDFQSVDVKTFTHPPALYKIGSFYDEWWTYQPLNLYIDPYLEWKDNRMALISENFWNWKELSMLMIAEKTLAPKQVIKIKFNNEEADSDVYELINFENEL